MKTTCLFSVLLLLQSIAFAISPGTLDPSFGMAGTNTTGTSSSWEVARAVALLPDGKIVVGGTNGASGNVSRYNSDGSLDLNFAEGGVASLGSVSIKDIAVQNDGKIVAVGSISGSRSSSDLEIMLARFLSDGSLDPSFGANGIAQTEIGPTYEAGSALSFQSDGKIVVAGFQITAPDVNVTSSDFLLARFDQDGFMDNSFGVNGSIVTDFFGGYDRLQDIALDSSDRIIAVGHATNIAGSRDFGIARFDVHGSLDPSFGMNGKVITDFGSAIGSSIGSSDRADSVVIQPDGKILAGGDATYSGGTDMAIARYLLDGTLDTEFDDDGKVVTDIRGNDYLRSLAIDNDGKILAGGFTRPSGVESGDLSLIRHNTDGSFDLGFGFGGIVQTDISGGGDHIASIGLQYDGKIIAVGSRIQDGDSDFAFARYHSVPEPGTTPLLAIAILVLRRWQRPQQHAY